MSKLLPAFELPIQREEYEPAGLTVRSCSDGHAVSLVSKGSNEELSTPETLKKITQQVLKINTYNANLRTLSNRYATVIDSQIDPMRDKELTEVLKEIEGNKPITFEFKEKATCMVECRQGAVVGLKDGNVTIINFGKSEREDMKGFMHSGEITCLAITKDGKFALSGSWDKTIRVWDMDTHHDVATFVGHSQYITCISVTPDSKFAISGSADNSLKAWHLDDRQEWVTFLGHAHIVKILAVSQNGKQVASASVDGVLKVWSLEDRRLICTLEGHTDFVTCLAFTADESQIVSGSHDMTIKVWNVDLRRETATLTGHTRYIECLAITPDGHHIVSGAGDNSIKVWSTSDFREEATLLGHMEEVRCLAVTPDSRFILSGSHDKTVKMWSIEEMCEVATFDGHSDRVKSVVTSLDGNHGLSLSSDELKVWLLGEQSNFEFFDGDIWDVTCLTVTRDGKYCVAGSSKGEVKLWGFESMKEICQFSGHSSWVTCICSTSDGRLAASGSVDRSVKVWDLLQGQEYATFAEHTSTIECICVSPSNTMVVSGSGDNTIKVWSLETKQAIVTFVGHKKWLTCAGFTQDGRYVISASVDRSIKVWHVIEQREVSCFTGHSDLIECMVVSPDGKCVLSGSGDFTIKLWSLESMSELFTFVGHTGRVKCLAITADGGHVISGSSDSTIKVWCLLEKRELTTLVGHTQMVKALEVTQNGKYVVSCSDDLCVKVWSLEEGREIMSIPGYMKQLHCFALTADGSRVVMGSADRSLVCFNISEKPVCERLAQKSDNLSSVLTPANLRKLKTGQLTSKPVYMSRVTPYNFNSLHISAYFNHSLACGFYIRSQTPIIRGVYGSPLTVALKRNTSKCIDTILESMANMCQDDSVCMAFKAITEDIPSLLGRNSPFLVQFFHVLLTSPSQVNLPQFIAPSRPLPATRFFPIRLIHLHDFAIMNGEAQTETDTELVEFGVSLVRWNFEPGSNDSLMLLNALGKCRNKKVLTTHFAVTLIETKWEHFFSLTLTLTFTYLLLLISMVLLMFSYWRTDVFGGGFLALNVLMLLYEALEIIGFGKAYLTNLWNLIDLARGVLSIAWTCLLLFDDDNDPQYLRLAVVGLCFLRGFTYFRSFTSTRIFVYMTIQVVKEIYSFLGILAYSVFAFGILASVMNDDNGALTSWTIAFNVLIGQSDTTDFGFVQWILFMVANVANVVIMLNLLISLLSEAYDKTQMSLLENNLHMKLDLIIEYESLLFWRRSNGYPTVMVECKAATESNTANEEWVGRINKIVKSVKDENKTIEKKLKTMEGQVLTVEKNIRADIRMIIAKVAEMKSQPEPLPVRRSHSPSSDNSSNGSLSSEEESESEHESSGSIPMIHYADLARRVSANPLLTAAFFRRTSSNVMGSPKEHGKRKSLDPPKRKSHKVQRRETAKAKLPNQRGGKRKVTIPGAKLKELGDKMDDIQKDIDARMEGVEGKVSGMKKKLEDILLLLQYRK